MIVSGEEVLQAGEFETTTESVATAALEELALETLTLEVVEEATVVTLLDTTVLLEVGALCVDTAGADVASGVEVEAAGFA